MRILFILGGLRIGGYEIITGKRVPKVLSRETAKEYFDWLLLRRNT